MHNDKCEAKISPSGLTAKRLSWLDDAKMFAMLAVIVFHVIGYMPEGLQGKGEASNLIGTFNMQLFMFLAGYTSMKSLENVTSWNKYWNYVLKIALRLMLPTFAIGALRALLTLDPSAFGNEQWFLKMLFRYLLVFATVNWLFFELEKFILKQKDNKLLSTLFAIVRYIIFFTLMFFLSKTKLPEFASYFLIGYLMKKHDVITSFFSRQDRKWFTPTVTTLIVCSILLIGYTYPLISTHSFYSEPFWTLYHNHQTLLFVQRQLCGLGWVMALTPLFILFSRRYTRFSLWGSKSLGLYIIHTFLMRLILDRVSITYSECLGGWLMVVALTLIFTAASLFIISLLERNKYTNFLFLGAGLAVLRKKDNTPNTPSDQTGNKDIIKK